MRIGAAISKVFEYLLIASDIVGLSKANSANEVENKIVVFPAFDKIALSTPSCNETNPKYKIYKKNYLNEII